jgi:hypothetical protein
MIRIFMAILALAVSGPIAPQAPPAARITGRALTMNTNIPIVGATVTVLRADTASTSTNVAGRVWSVSARTDELGAFVVEGLDAGTYLVTATASGYFPADATPNRPEGFGRMLTLSSSQQLGSVDFHLGKAGILHGTVVDDKGAPFARVRVSITQPMQVAGARRLMHVGTGTSTDDRGRFQLSGLAPGDYFLVAMGSPFGVDDGRMVVPLESGSRPGFIPTYFPSTTSPVLAQSITILPDAEIDDVRITLWTSPTFDVRGRVVDEAGVAAEGGGVQLLQMQDGDVRVFIPANTAVANDGSFVFSKVPTGSYVLQARSNSGFGALPIEVIDDRPVEYRVATLAPRAIKGRFIFEGAAPASTAGFRLNVQPTDFVRGPAGGNRAPDPVVNDDWTFELPGVQYIGVIRGSGPQGWLVRRVTIGGRDVTDVPIAYLERDYTDVEVVFSNRRTSVEVQVVDAKDSSVPGATVVIFAEDRQKLAYPSRYIAVGFCDQRGVFRATALPADRYLVAAVPAGKLTAGGDVDLAFLEAIRARATPASLQEAQKPTVRVSVLNIK